MVLVYSLFNETNYPVTELSSIQYQVSPFSSVPFRLRLSGRHKLAIVPRVPSLKPVADQFIADMTALHPALNFTSFGTNLGPDLDGLYIPGFSEQLRTFASEAELESFISNPDYDRNWESGTDDKIWGAIVFNSEGPSYDYKIRMNNSMVPQPSQPKVNVLQRGYSDAAIRSYLYAKMPLTGPPFLVEKGTEITRLEYPGFMSLQLMVDRWILNTSIPMSSLDPTSLLLAADATIAMCLVPGGPRWVNKSDKSVMGPISLARNKLLQSNRVAEWNAIQIGLMSWLKEMSYKPQQVSLTPFPYFAFNENAFYGTALSILSFFLVIAYVFPVSRLIRGLVLEKEMKLREGMKMMGLGDAALFGSWFTFYGIFWAVLSIIITLISSRTLFKFSFQNGGGGTIWFIFFIFGLSCTSFAYLISVFFTQSKTASSIGIVVFIASFFPVFSVSDGSIETSVKLAASLLCPTAFGLSLNAAGLLEQNGAGVTRDTATAILNNFSVQNGIAMMILDTFLYAVLAWYADAVLPVSLREYGVPRPWFFPFTIAYWREVFGLSVVSDSRSSTSVSNILAATGPDSSYIEAPDAELIAKEKAGRFVSINRLRKEFETPDGIKVAVNNIDMTMYEGQIYVLLGHNGAGKTTTISMLTGLITPTSGTMNIFGRDVSTQLGEVRKDLGVCPQHNVLWPELTVREHLQIFSEIKGVPAEKRNAEILKAVADVGLTEKIDVLSSNLSGGQKRKLSVCIALVGGSRVIFLDEPTSGMDPYSRRSTWQILQNAREGRVMVLTTHFMDEADILGDRICIMADGGVKCCGSSSFLKERFGVGYILTLIKGTNASVHDIVSLIRNHVPEVNVATNVGAELNLRLPLTSSSVFPVLLAELDSKLQSLGVISYGVSITSIEDVFLKISGGDHFSNEDETTDKVKKIKDASDSIAINTTEAREASTPQSSEPTMKSVLAAMRKSNLVLPHSFVTQVHFLRNDGTTLVVIGRASCTRSFFLLF
jgi:ATP-binding cassette, subfamily A (ABC1), member 3